MKTFKTLVLGLFAMIMLAAMPGNAQDTAIMYYAPNGWIKTTTNAGNLLYAGGNFTYYDSNTRAAGRIATYNDSTGWNTINNLYTDSTVAALILNHDSVLYIGGQFGSAGGHHTGLLAIYNINSKKYITSSNFSIDTNNGYFVNAMCLDTANQILYVAGSFLSVNDTTTKIYNLAAWHIQDSTWHSIGGTNIYGQINTLAMDPIKHILYAGGVFDSAGGNSINNLAAYYIDSNKWKHVGNGDPNSLVLTLDMYNNNLYAGGTFTTMGSTPINWVAKDSDGYWTSLDSGLTGGPQVCFLVNYKNTLCIGGQFVF